MSYIPDKDANPSDQWATAFLSTRDLSLGIPINYVPTPGVTLESACFPDKQYDDQATARCFSNLLAAGFQRFVMDLYWDVGRQVWSLCPVRVPQDPQLATTLTVPTFASKGSATALSTATLAARDSDKSARSPSPSWTVDATRNGDSIYSLGSYQCTASSNLSVILSVLTDYMDETSNTLDANLIYLTFNLHAAASTANPDQPAPDLSPSDMASPHSILSRLLRQDLSSWLYTPTILRMARSHLAGSWDSEDPITQPDHSYMTLEDGGHTSPDGWPSESFIEFSKSQRLLVEFGSIDDQVTAYDRTQDERSIFPSNYISNSHQVSQSSSGKVKSGCIFDRKHTSLSRANSSWATTVSFSPPSSDFSISSLMYPLSNLSACGVSPILTSTLGTAAHLDPTPYLNFTSSFLWPWAAEQPSTRTGSGASAIAERCAALDILDSGRWVVRDCRESYRAACWGGRASQGADSPYLWNLSSDAQSYAQSRQSCVSGWVFLAPRTALENAYLASAATETIPGGAKNEGKHRYVWVNFNALEHPGCWVAGVNSSCPYQSGPIEDSRTVVIPTVAAIIVFVISFLTVFVKGAANRRQSRRGRRRRGSDGWDYEGVPS